MIDRASRELNIEAGRVVSVSVRRNRGGPEVHVVVNGPRQTGRVRFTGAGELVDVRID